MDYQKITCNCTGKTIQAERMYKIKGGDNVLEDIVSICYNCPFTNNDNPKCQNCYGTIVQNYIRQINDETGRIKMDAVNYRNNFYKVGNEYVELMDADEFLETIDIVANLNNSNWNHGQRISDHLRAYSYPKTWKTDCMNCKLRYHQKNELPPCEKTKDYVASLGINLSTATEKQIQSIKLPPEMICKEQTQRMYFV